MQHPDEESKQKPIIENFDYTENDKNFVKENLERVESLRTARTLSAQDDKIRQATVVNL